MRISDSLTFQLANRRLGKSQSDFSETGDTLATGKAVQHPWDDPAKAGLIEQYAQETARQDSIASITGTAMDELNLADGNMGQLIDTLSRGHELAVQLANDTYSAADRAAAAQEVTQMFGAALAQVNAKMGDRYVFGGMKDGSAPFDATGAYLGDANVRQIEVAPNQYHDASIRADQAFKGVGGGVDVLQALKDFSTALSTNNKAGIQTAIQQLSDGIQQVSEFRSKAGGMYDVMEVAQSTARLNSNTASDARSNIEDADIFDSTTKYAAAEKALQATMAALQKQFSLTLIGKL